jgi:hypothetical protein
LPVAGHGAPSGTFAQAARLAETTYTYESASLAE